MEPNQTTGAPEQGQMTPEALIAMMEQKMSKFFEGNKAQTAAGVEVKELVDPASVATKAKGEQEEAVTGLERMQGYADPLRKSFENLARLSPVYRKLGSDKAMNDPYAYLHQIDAKGEFIVSDAELDAMAQVLLKTGSRRAGECPDGAMFINEWIDKGAGGQLIRDKLESGVMSKGWGKFNEAVSKALDTTGGAALIRTDLEPILYEAYLRRFPAAARIRSFPANGLVHNYDVRSDIGDAALVDELGDIVAAGGDATSTIVRKASSNIAILVSRRGISLKLTFATRQSGMNFPLSGTDNLEVVGGITALGRLNQTLLFQGNYSQVGGTANDENGAYNTKGYDGLRYILKDPTTSKTYAPGDTHRKNLDALASQIDDAGGSIQNLIIFQRHGSRMLVQDELEDFMRIMADKSRETGIRRDNLMGGLMLFGGSGVEFVPVPGAAQTKGIGYYDISSVSYEDMYLCDPDGMGLAYLGSPAPVILEIPLGFDNRLGQVYILFQMNGLVVSIPSFHRKYRVPKQTY
jgi:hypothetical protein